MPSPRPAPAPGDPDAATVSTGVGVSVSVGVSVPSDHLQVGVGEAVGAAVRDAVGVKVTVGKAVGICVGGAVGINSGVGGIILVGTSNDDNAFGEQPWRTTAPAPIPAIFKKSLRETIRIS